MADKLIFPIGFDIDKGLKEVISKGDKGLKELEDAIAKHPITVKLRLDSGKNRNVQSELVGFKKELSELTREWNALTAAERGGVKGAELRDKYRILQREAQGYVSTLRAAVNQEDKLAAASDRAAKTTNNLTKEFNKQDGYVSRLIKRLVVYAGYSQIMNFLTSVRQVTAEFELQRVSLGAIIQDQTKANALFSEIKQFALKSPISILDLTKYTKQVAAYRVSADELFDTTKRLADISVGLGVSMDRIVLAYGQVKAASFLRASEVRQFTEAGIPMLELVAEKLSKMNGEMVTTEQAMQTISERGVGFEVVKEIFEDMTSAGGMFYNMQERQGNTLYGMWAKLGDAASVMYEEIGNSDTAKWAMKGMIQALTDLMRNWERAGRAIGAVAIVIAGLVLQKKILGVEITKVMAIQQTYNARMIKANTLAASNSRLTQAQGVAMGIYAKTLRTASTAAAAFGTSLTAIKSALISTGWGALLVALGYVVDKLFLTKSTAEKVQESLNEIETETRTLTAQGIRNFTHLADTALKAPTGSSEQKETLAELERTYKDMIPVEQLTLENLRKLKSEGYAPLTQSIREYIAEQQRVKALNTVSEEYGAIKLKHERKLTDYFREQGWSEQEIARFWDQFYISASDKSKTLTQAIAEAAEKGGHNAMEVLNNIFSRTGWQSRVDKWTYEKIGINTFGSWLGGGVDSIELMYDAIQDENNAIEQYNERAKAAESATNQFAEAQERAAKKLENTRYIRMGSNGTEQNLDSENDSYLLSQMQLNAQFKNWADMIQNDTQIISALQQLGIQINSEWFNIVENLKENDLGTITSINFDAIIASIDNFLKNYDGKNAELYNMAIQLRTTLTGMQTEYKKMIPDDAIVKTWRGRWQMIAKNLKVSTNFMGQYLMQSGEDFEAYRKRIKDEIDRIHKLVASLQKALALQLKGEISGNNKMTPQEIADAKKRLSELQQQQKALQQLYNELQTVNTESPNKKSRGGKSKKSSGGKSEQDKRFELLKNEFSMVKKLYDEYKKMADVVGGEKAATKLNELYGDTLKMLAKRHNITLPTTINQTTTSLDILLNKMKSLKGVKGKKGQLLFPNAQKEIENYAMQIETLRVDEIRKKAEAKLKELASQISHTKAAKEFYDTILNQTGDIVLAANLTIDLYGETGSALQKELADQIRTYFDNSSGKIDIPLDVIATDNQINYRKLAELVEKYKTELGEKPYEALKKIAQEGQKDMANLTKGYLKDLKAAEDYADKREKLALDTAEKIRQIQENTNYTDEVKEKLISGYRNKEMKEAAKLEWEAFQDTPLYVQMFDDLENASTTSLEMMKSRIEELSQTWGAMFDPTQLKEMQSRVNEISEQLRKRNPWKSLKESWKEYQDAVGSVTLPNAVSEVGKASAQYYKDVKNYGVEHEVTKKSKENLDTKKKIAEIVRKITSEEGKQLKGMKALNEANKVAFDNLKIARGQVEIYAAEYNDAVAEAKKNNPTDYEKDPSVLAARENLENAKRTFRIYKAIADYFQNQVKQTSKLKEGLIAAATNVTEWLNAGEAAARAIADLSAEFGADEDDVQYFNDIADGLGNISAGLQDIIQNGLQGNIAGMLTSVLSAIPKMVIGFSQIFNASRIKKANKEIKRQQELLEQLEYTMSRLETAAEKLFGADYLANLKEQRSALQAQAEAYQKQIEAEKSKGKKADKDELKQMEESYRDVLDQLDDLQKASEQMLGSTLESKARDAAKAWIEAYKEMGAAGANTTQAMKEQFQDMIENMVVEGAMAAVMQKALEPMFKMIDNMDEADFRNESFWKNVVSEANKGAELADEGAQILMKYLENAGVQIKDISNEATGISRGTSSATSEEINANTSALNTQNFYIAQIHSNVSQILARMGNENINVPAIDYTDLVQQSVDRLSMIERYSSEILVECRRNAIAAENALAEIRRVIVPRGSVATHQVYVAM